MSAKADGRTAAPGSLREEQKRFTRARMLDAALQVFADRGYATTKIEEITAAAGASRATFYLHFDSKFDLFLALWADRLPEMERQLRELDRVLVGGSRDELRAWVASHLDWYATHRVFAQVHDEVRASERDRESPQLDYVALMPRYLKALPARRRREARTELWLFMQLLRRVGVWWPIDARVADVSTASMVELLTGSYAEGLRISRAP